MSTRVVVYGTEWCGDSNRTRQHLAARGIAFDYVDIDQDEQAARQITEWNNGKRVTPTVVITDKHGESFRIAEPTNEELDHLLRRDAA